MRDDVSNPKMEQLATKVAERLYEGEWEVELVTREIATAEDKAQALERLKTLEAEIRRARAIIKADKSSDESEPVTDDERSYGPNRTKDQEEANDHRRYGGRV